MNSPAPALERSTRAARPSDAALDVALAAISAALAEVPAPVQQWSRVSFLGATGPANTGTVLEILPCTTWGRMARVQWDDGTVSGARYFDLVAGSTPIQSTLIRSMRFPAIRATRARRAPLLNVSARRVGGLTFVKVGRLCFSFCLTRTFRPL